ncbi:hypothetical protein RJ53_03800 [Methanocalculus chunghsingensis]|uniref:Uncharacterized protein n=1 Tax=Methanocalculus chunghsingensis TaxID=156457 RepID=A0A8J7W9A1_9EURY|nr:hypothetical protein [Methanocalculus chunghsingensis]MBR1368675.1 hypothetical protein [Methanocalculus chunghsingensis]
MDKEEERAITIGKLQENMKRTLQYCLQEAFDNKLTADIRCEEGGMSASVITISGEPGGAEYTDAAGTIFGDTAILRFPADGIFTCNPLTLQQAEERSGRARIFNPARLSVHTKTDLETDIKTEANAGIGRLTIQMKTTGSLPQDLRIELWNNSRICATDTTDQRGEATFKLLSGRYECRVRDGIKLISRSIIDFPGGDLKSIVLIPGDGQ